MSDIELLDVRPSVNGGTVRAFVSADFVTAEWERQCAPATPAPAA